jgi:hypothetical protein
VSFTTFANAASRDRYGAGVYSPIIYIYRPSHRGLSPALAINSVTIGTDAARARVVSVSFGILHRPVEAERSRWFVPYYVVTAGPRFARVPNAGRSTVAGVRALLGVELLRRVGLTANFDALPEVFGERLTTLSWSAAARIPLY